MNRRYMKFSVSKTINLLFFPLAILKILDFVAEQYEHLQEELERKQVTNLLISKIQIKYELHFH